MLNDLLFFVNRIIYEISRLKLTFGLIYRAKIRIFERALFRMIVETHCVQPS